MEICIFGRLLSDIYVKKEQKELLQSLKSGDEQAYKDLFYSYFASLVGYAYGIVKDKEVAEDLVQELFVSFWYEKKYNGIMTGLNGYLYRSAKNSCLNYLRDEKRRNDKLSDMRMDEAEENDFYADEMKEREDVYEVIHQLPEQCKLVFTLCCLEGLKYQEAADRLGISVNTVRTQMGRAFKFLRGVLRDRGVSAICLFIYRHLLFGK